MNLENILSKQKIMKRNPNWKSNKKQLGKIALSLMLAGAVVTCSTLYIKNRINNLIFHEKTNSEYSEPAKKGENINLEIDGITENFIFSSEIVNAKELNQGIIIWEKIKKDEYHGRKVSYPEGHLYVFKDIKTREIVGKFAVSGGILENDVKSITKGVYVLNKFELWPDYMSTKGEIIFPGGHSKNPWGYGRFYHYPVTQKGNTIETLSAKSFKRSIYPDKKKRYLHADALINEGINGKKDYKKKKKELAQTEFQPTRTIGCAKTSSYAIDFLEERINLGIFRLAYIDNISQ